MNERKTRQDKEQQSRLFNYNYCLLFSSLLLSLLYSNFIFFLAILIQTPQNNKKETTGERKMNRRDATTYFFEVLENFQTTMI